MSSYRFSEGSSLFRKSVLHRIRFGNTVRLKAEFANSAASSLRVNEFPGSDRRSSRSLSAYPDQWGHHHHHRRRVSNAPPAIITTASTGDLTYPSELINPQILETKPRALTTALADAPSLTVPSPILSPNALITSAFLNDQNNDENPPIILQRQNSVPHLPECVHSTSQPNNLNAIEPNDIRQRGRSRYKKDAMDSTNELASSMKATDIESESSSIWTNETYGIQQTQTSMSNAESACTCQLLWQLEKETDSIDKFKLFFKRDHLNVDWDYVQGSSEV